MPYFQVLSGRYPVRTCFLKVTAADFGLWDVGSHGKDGCAVAVTVVKAIHQMQRTGPERAENGRDASGDVGIGYGGKCACLLVMYVDEFDFAIPVMDGVNQGIGRVADDAVNAFDTCIDYERHEILCNGSRHDDSPERELVTAIPSNTAMTVQGVEQSGLNSGRQEMMKKIICLRKGLDTGKRNRFGRLFAVSGQVQEKHITGARQGVKPQLRIVSFSKLKIFHCWLKVGYRQHSFLP